MREKKEGYLITHAVQFHEVDSMNIVHHSQYILWLEKARFSFAKETLDLSMQDFAKLGILLPVIELKCKYLRSAKLDQQVEIYIQLLETERAVARFAYQLYDSETGVKFMEAETEHAFVNSEGKLFLSFPEIWREGVENVKRNHPGYIVARTTPEKAVENTR